MKLNDELPPIGEFEIPYALFDNINTTELRIMIEEFDLGAYDVLKPNYLIRLDKLQKLDFCGIHISYDIFKNEICNLINLENLMLMYADIDIIPPEINKLVNLKNIILRGNNISALPDNFFELNKLKELNLMSNQFIIFPINILKITSLKKVHFGYNPLKSEYQNLIDSFGDVIFIK